MALINVAINFGYEYFCFVIYFSEIFFVKTFFKTSFPKFLFQNFFSKIYFSEFFFFNFPKFIFQNFFFNIFSWNFFFKFFFPKFFLQIFFLRALLNASPFTETKRTPCICVMKNIVYSKRSKLDFTCVIRYFFGLYCSHHTRPEKLNSFLATHNILLYFFRNLLYLIEVLKCFLDGI